MQKDHKHFAVRWLTTATTKPAARQFVSALSSLRKLLSRPAILYSNNSIRVRYPDNAKNPKQKYIYPVKIVYNEVIISDTKIPFRSIQRIQYKSETSPNFVITLQLADNTRVKLECTTLDEYNAFADIIIQSMVRFGHDLIKARETKRMSDT